MWRTALLAGWGLWLERNNHTFGGGYESSIEDIWDKIRFWVAFWLSDVKEFKDCL